ncbi:MAG TPA: hypothetical protein VFK32_07755, partial [Tepidiformaceae bacterium]|nr:hypothetical protein [Tepidiformaceae bacterium]
MRKLSWALGLMLLVIAGACGGDDAEDPRDEQSDNGGTTTQPTRADSGGSAGNPDFHACDLFTAEEIGAVLDEEVPEGVDYLAVAAGATNCSWDFVFIEVLLEDGEDWFDAVHFAD